MKKWVAVRAEFAGSVVELAGRLDFPFSRSLEKQKSVFVVFDCLMIHANGVWKPYSGTLHGAFGQAALRRDRIVSYIPLRESSGYWDRIWHESCS